MLFLKKIKHNFKEIKTDERNFTFSGKASETSSFIYTYGIHEVQ